MSLGFREFPKIARLNRECIITEKIDGTNACVVVGDDGEVAAQSRNQLLVGGKSDAFGFALWVQRNEQRLRDLLGPGHHFGEWWGPGIQRGYPVNGAYAGKRLSLFNVERWKDLPVSDDLRIVPVLYRGRFTTDAVRLCLDLLQQEGSSAAPGFMRPEGVVVFHLAANMGFKVTLEKDEEHKGQSPKRERVERMPPATLVPRVDPEQP
jgi:hypothetical protein